LLTITELLSDKSNGNQNLITSLYLLMMRNKPKKRRKTEMEHREARYIRLIEKILNSEELTAKQREVLVQFDRFNELEAGCALNTRLSYLNALRNLGVGVGKPFEEMTKEDLQTHFHEESKHHKEGTIMTPSVMYTIRHFELK
jgi:hypothetical protein